MKTERSRKKRATRRRWRLFWFVSRRLPLYLPEFKLRTLPNLLKFEGNLTPWLLLPLPPEPPLETHLTLVLTVPLVETTSLK
jgi:hypothetical protein